MRTGLTRPIGNTVSPFQMAVSLLYADRVQNEKRKAAVWCLSARPSVPSFSTMQIWLISISQPASQRISRPIRPTADTLHCSPLNAAWLSPLINEWYSFCTDNQSINLFVEIAHNTTIIVGWLGSRVVSVLDSGAEGPGFKSQLRRCRVTVLGKLFTPILPLFTKQQN